MDRYREAEHPPFDAWLLTRASHAGFVGALATAATGDRKFPKTGDLETVRQYLRGVVADGDMFDAIDDAEVDWKAAGSGAFDRGSAEPSSHRWSW